VVPNVPARNAAAFAVATAFGHRVTAQDPASFCDPSSHVYRVGTRVLRTVTARSTPHYERLRDAGLLRAWMNRFWVVDTREVPRSELPGVDGDIRYVLEQTWIRFISYPYEWPFGALKAAALRTSTSD
jgi:hypothetical protein